MLPLLLPLLCRLLLLPLLPLLLPLLCRLLQGLVPRAALLFRPGCA